MTAANGIMSVSTQQALISAGVDVMRHSMSGAFYFPVPHY